MNPNTNILLIEDSEDDVFFMKRALRSIGATYPMHVASDGQAALTHLTAVITQSNPVRPPMPDLILLDLRLPFVPGLDVLKWLRAQSALNFVPVVVLTSSREERDMEQAYSLGANSFLVKPSESGKLVSMVKVLTEYWLAFNEIPRVDEAA